MFLVPAAALYAFIVLWPSLQGAGLAFTDWDGLSADRNFVGLEQFRTVFSDDKARAAVGRTLLIAFSSDWLYPPSGSEEVAAALAAAGKEVALHVIEAPYGHDCFLLEEARQIPIVREFLARP